MGIVAHMPTKKSKRETVVIHPVAHIVTPARRIERAPNELTPALCGAVISQAAEPTAGICAACVLAQFTKDDESTAKRVEEAREAGRVAGRRAALDEAHSAISAVPGGSRSC